MASVPTGKELAQHQNRLAKGCCGVIVPNSATKGNVLYFVAGRAQIGCKTLALRSIVAKGYKCSHYRNYSSLKSRVAKGPGNAGYTEGRWQQCSVLRSMAAGLPKATGESKNTKRKCCTAVLNSSVDRGTGPLLKRLF